MSGKNSKSVYEEARLEVIGLTEADLIRTSGDLTFGTEDGWSNVSDGGWV